MILINLETKKEVENVTILADLVNADGSDGYYIKTNDTTIEYIDPNKYLILDAAYVDEDVKVYTFMKWMDEENIPYTYETCKIEPLESHLCINESNYTWVCHNGKIHGGTDDLKKYMDKKVKRLSTKK